MKKKLTEGVDFYYNEQGYVVLTASYHLERGHCCGNGCLHCPYAYSQVPEPRRSELLAKRKNDGQQKD
ncbi:MAG: DUF5522 domain-containing protein [Candidatus Pseudobacter hemicellulosilyticus]|uniref:DUF5522 domain-containing protein n=1 Tax=Candidatus Pseudobacter hemicellulosilyticus TaxID=3121375 RepID=A0AAJ6BH29_9BACT|nr:MAG: DUF5522 domain-containing protein [Pseudobacter sp.]